MAGRRPLAPAPPPAPLDGAVAGDSSQSGSHQRRLPCSSCTRRRPLRQCHTAARVTTWPTTTREGNRPPEGSMALGCPAADRAGRAALQAAVEAGNPLPFLRGGQMGGGRRDQGPPRLQDRPTALSAWCPKTRGETSPVLHQLCSHQPPLPPPCHSQSPPASTAPSPVQLSLRRATRATRSRLAGTLTPAYPQPHPPGGGACGDCLAQPQHPQHSLGGLSMGSPSCQEGDRGAQAPHSASKGALW